MYHVPFVPSYEKIVLASNKLKEEKSEKKLIEIIYADVYLKIWRLYINIITKIKTIFSSRRPHCFQFILH